MEDERRLWTLNQQAELLVKEMEILKPRFKELDLTETWWEVIERVSDRVKKENSRVRLVNVPPQSSSGDKEEA